MANQLSDRSPVEEMSLKTTSWDEACTAASTAYFPHSLSPVSPGCSLDMSLHAADLGPLTVGKLSFGADVHLECGELETGYEVNIPVSGHIRSICGPEEVVSAPGEGTVYTPKGNTTITWWSADCALYGIKFERPHLETELERLLQHPIRSPIRLRPSLGVSTEPGLGWVRLVRMLMARLGDADSLLQYGFFVDQLCATITTGFLLVACHDYSQELTDPQSPARPKTIRRAVDALESRPDQPWSVADIAELTGSSVRRLQEGFEHNIGMSPITYLREVRLKRVHEELVQGLDDNVTDIALRWGFTHLGRFAAAYRHKYGVTPSHTLSTDRGSRRTR